MVGKQVGIDGRIERGSPTYCDKMGLKIDAVKIKVLKVERMEKREWRIDLNSWK